MLGSLARWLRIIGYDTLYYPDRDDNGLREEAEKTSRILVTRDTELYKKTEKQGIPVIFLDSENTMDQLKEITEILQLCTEPANTRCPRCNGLLESIEKELVETIVPAESYNSFDVFWVCAECGAIYWKGSHWTNIQRTLESIKDSKSL